MSQLALDTQRVESFALVRHMEMTSRDEVLFQADPRDVADRAHELARTYYRGECGDENSTNVVLVTYAGWLIYALQSYGLNFEQLCDVAEQGVAWCVRAVSPDNRLTAVKRQLQLKGEISMADVNAQLVKLAEITCVCRMNLDLPAGELFAQVNPLKTWVEDHSELLGVLYKLEKRDRMKPALKLARGLLAKLSHRVETARRPKLLPLPLPMLPLERPDPVPEASLFAEENAFEATTPAAGGGPEPVCEPARVLQYSVA